MRNLFENLTSVALAIVLLGALLVSGVVAYFALYALGFIVVVIAAVLLIAGAIKQLFRSKSRPPKKGDPIV